VALADDQRVVRDGLALVLGMLPEVELVGVAADGAAAVHLVDDQAPQVVLMDLRMPVMDGVEATRVIREAHPDVQVIVLTTYADDQSVFAALRAGARGYLTKDAGAEEIAQAIAKVAAGEAMLDASVQARLLEHLGTSSRLEPSVEVTELLTGREIEVLTLVGQGLSNAEICGQLVVSEATVKTHINRIFAKTGVRDRAQAVAYAYRHGLLSP
jgi:DNA-binding NarL/FixJ family response regulator